jgi:UrcA family protein
MSASIRFSITATAALVLGAGLTAGAAAAPALRIAVGDLSTPTAAQAFDHRLEAAERRLCRPRYAPQDLDGPAACRRAVREEALEQLTPAQQRAYAEAHGAPARLAGR